MITIIIANCLALLFMQATTTGTSNIAVIIIASAFTAVLSLLGTLIVIFLGRIGKTVDKLLLDLQELKLTIAKDYVTHDQMREYYNKD